MPEMPNMEPPESEIPKRLCTSEIFLLWINGSWSLNFIQKAKNIKMDDETENQGPHSHSDLFEVEYLSGSL